ncbi:MAG: TRAP transporter substrate-binding protein DctP [Gammaproteobacteria bacterium]|nr:TRAP transporter substrate-binding protein DctP [Gammaproteobacteria bacterium]
MSISDRGRGGWLGAVVALLVAFSVPMHAATIKLATLSPDGSVWITLLREAGVKIEQETAGRVQLKIYPGGVMGDDPTVMRKMRIGQLQAAILTTGTFGNIFTDAQLYNLPMQFASFEEVDYVRERLDGVLRQGLEDNGFVCPGLAEVGMAYAMSTRPVRSISDTSGIRFWTPSGNVGAVKAVTAFGISPVQLAITDVLTGLQTGLIDAVATPLVGALALQWHNQLDYILDIPFMYIYAVMALPERSFRRLGDADQEVVRRLLGDAVRAADARNRADHHAVREVLQSQGLEFIQPSAAEVREWQARAHAASLDWVEDGIVSAANHDLLASHLADFRNASSGNKRAE